MGLILLYSRVKCGLFLLVDANLKKKVAHQSGGGEDIFCHIEITDSFPNGD